MKAELEGIYNVDGVDYELNINLEYSMWKQNADIELTTIRGLPPQSGAEVYRSNASHGGRYVNMYIHSLDAQKVAAHEFLHLVGFGDMYRDQIIEGKRRSVTFKGHENDIMGTRSGSFQGYHIKTLLNNYGGTK